MLRVLVADDHGFVRAGLKQILLEADPACVVGEATNGGEALEKALTEDWDVVILDISMPVQSGLQVLRDLRAQRPLLPVIMLSMHSGPAYVQGAFNLGADGYLNKDAAPDELVEAISQVLAGSKYLGRSLGAKPE